MLGSLCVQASRVGHGSTCQSVSGFSRDFTAPAFWASTRAPGSLEPQSHPYLLPQPSGLPFLASTQRGGSEETRARVRQGLFTFEHEKQVLVTDSRHRVYRAMLGQTEHEEAFAVKEYMLDSEAAVITCMREAALLCRLRHPNIVQVS